MAPDLHAALAAVVGPDHVRPVAGQHAWLVAPGSPAEVADVIRASAAAGAAVVPVGAGFRAARVKSLGDRARVHVATERLDQVIQLDEASLLCHVQAGLTGAALEQVLAPRGLSLGDYPPSILGSTIGGLIGVRTPGKSSARHGFFEDAVAGVSAVLADGRTIHTRVAPRRSTGPDLARALSGSEGTLGFITAAVLRIHRRPEVRLLAAFVLPSVDAAIAAAFLALREECAPAGLRIVDAAEARRHFPETALADGEAVVVAATAGPTDLAACDRDLIASAALAEGGRPADVALAERWWKRRLGLEPIPGPAPTFQVSAGPRHLAAAYHAIRAAVPGARLHVSRFDLDGAVLFATLVDEAGAALTGPAAAAAHAAAEAAATAAGAWLLGARPTAMAPYLAALRAALDPHGIMNPGALIDPV
ncbi:MAG: FAD-binding oxidoreductase [Kofleriaceae bacterium]